MNNSEKEKRTAVALGDFDGMHRAHQLVITGASDVIIYSVNNRFSLMQKSVFEKRCPNVVFADFDEIKNMTGEDFIEKIWIDVPLPLEYITEPLIKEVSLLEPY